MLHGLNVHGYGFQYAVIQHIEAVDGVRQLGWRFIGAEVPISLHGKELHADFIFYNERSGVYLVGECKRVDPALARWGFARTAYTFGSRTLRGSNVMLRPVIDELYCPNASDDKLHLRPLELPQVQSWYQVGVVIKTPEQKGDGVTADRDAISQAATQALRAANGFIELCAENPGIVHRTAGPHVPVCIVPVVFTTAALAASTLDLSHAALESGDLPSSMTFAAASWLWYQHALNRSLQAAVQGRSVAEEMPDWPAYFLRSAVRTVAIVSPDGIADLLEAGTKRFYTRG